MGRLDDIIERNKNPKTRFRKPVAPGKPATSAKDAPPATEPPAPGAKTGDAETQPGARLDKIIARNRRPNANFRWLKVGLAGVVLFVVLILLIFTDLATPPEDHRLTSPPAARPAGVDGVKLWKQPANKAGSAAAAAAPR